MTVEEKRAAIEEHCNKSTTVCSSCVLRKKVNCFLDADNEEIEENYNLLFGPEVVDKPEAADERGANNMEKQTITIDLERYDELVRKEAIYDRLTVSSDVNIYLVPRLEEVKTNA